MQTNTVMKKLIFPILAALALAACSKVEVAAPQREHPVQFAVVNHLQQTKATEGLAYPTSVPFGTFAWWTSGNWTGIAEDQAYVFMENQEVTYHSLEGSATPVWAPTSTYYWTRTGKLTFASYSPYTSAGTDNGYSTVPSYDVAKGFLFSNYTIVDATNVDLMYANLAANCTQEYNAGGAEVTDDNTPESGFNGVPTIFNHALCQVGFAFRAIGKMNPNVDRIVVDLTDVDILNIDKTGSFTQIPADATAPRWATDRTALATYEYAPASTLSMNLIESTAANVSSTTNYNALETRRILLPQALLTADTATDQLLQVKYTIKMHYKSAPASESDPAYWATENVTTTVHLNNGSIVSWKENQNITYRISINPYNAVPITFDPAVVDWTDVFSTDISIHPED